MKEPSPLAAFAAALRDPERRPPAAHRGAERRFAIYRNNVAVGLIGALEARFPAVIGVIGTEFFRAMARVFISGHPPRSPVLTWYGDDFPAFIRSFEPAAAYPYLADIARIDAARTVAYHAADASRLGAADFEAAGAALERARIGFHPAVAIIRSPHPALSIRRMSTEQPAPQPIMDWNPEDILVDRPDLDVTLSLLAPGEAVFLLALAEGAPLDEAAARAALDCAGFDLVAALARLIGTGMVSSLHYADPEVSS